MSTPSTLTADARRIWQAGVDAVNPEQLIANSVRIADGTLQFGELKFPLEKLGKIVVVGAGKAGAKMAAGLENVLAHSEHGLLEKVSGWVNVPENCVRPLRKINLHAARPVGLNEPTEEGVAGTREILKLVTNLDEHDLCLVLISGGGSALLPAPVPEITLAEKQLVTRFLSQAGATIQELNSVRQHLSQVKGGRLAATIAPAACVSLIISDVIGNPLEMIASGPTVRPTTTPADARTVLQKFDSEQQAIPKTIWKFLRTQNSRPRIAVDSEWPRIHHNLLIGTNAVALTAAKAEAERLGYEVLSRGSDNQGIASEEGKTLARDAKAIRDTLSPASQPVCILSGGEPVVELSPTEKPRKGGRNQELVLAAVEELWEEGMQHLAILSGGTDGEDGPTDAAGAFADTEILKNAKRQGLNPAESLAINNSYPFFEQCGGLLRTGLTETNVMDLRVALCTATE